MKLNDKTIELLSSDESKNILKKIVTKLNELDLEDFFGTEGWEKFFDLE